MANELPELKPCPCCSADLIGGERNNADGAGEFFYYHPHNHCILQSVGVWPHNIDAWNTRTAPKVKPLVWEAEDGRESCLDAEGCDKLYRVLVRHDGSAVLRHNASSFQEEGHESEDAAKAAAQDDYERRILSSIQ